MPSNQDLDQNAPQSTRAEAEARAAHIRQGLISFSNILALMREARERQDYKTLGYDEWADYVQGEFGSELMPRLTRDERSEYIAYLSGTGMTQRQIASAAGSSKSTVGDVLSEIGQKTGSRPDSGPRPDPKTGGLRRGRRPGSQGPRQGSRDPRSRKDLERANQALLADNQTKDERLQAQGEALAELRRMVADPEAVLQSPGAPPAAPGTEPMETTIPAQSPVDAEQLAAHSEELAILRARVQELEVQVKGQAQEITRLSSQLEEIEKQPINWRLIAEARYDPELRRTLREGAPPDAIYDLCAIFELTPER
jgi:hypothetical protein